MSAIRILCLLLVTIVGTGVVLQRDPLRQVLAFSLYGLLFSVLFLVFEAPDVALSQVVVGAVVLPLMVMLTLVRAREDDEQ